MKKRTTKTPTDLGERQLREMNEALLVSSVRQHELTQEAEHVANKMRESEERMGAQLAATQVLQDISTRLIQGSDIHALHEQILDAAMTIMGSDMASLQSYDAAQDALHMLAFRGLDPEFGRTFKLVRRDARTAGSIAREKGRRVVVPDVEMSDFMVSTQALQEYRQLGIRAVQSTPLISRSGSLLGMISTHWHQPHQPSEGDLHLLDILARQAADLIEQKHAEEALRASETRLVSQAAALARLNELSSRLWRIPSLREGLDQMLEATLELLGAEKGNVQLLDPNGRVLRIVVQRGFNQGFLDSFAEVTVEDESACGRALRLGERVLIEDTEVDPSFSPYRSIATEAGFRAVQSTPLIGHDGTVLGILSTHFRCVHEFRESELRRLDLYIRQAIDFIERKRIEDKQKDSERRKDEFLAILAHELRNPLGPVRNAAHYLKLKALEPELRRPVEMIERQVTHMARLIDDLLDVSRISRGMLELRLEMVSLTEIIEATIDACSTEIQARGHTLQVDLPKRPVELRGDRARLIQILCNLITNSAKYTSPGGFIGLSATITNGSLELSIRDNGMGVPPEKLTEIFELFAQVEPSLERQGGLGIGLTLVRQLVELHGGSITARSEGVGHGSEFIVTLPITVVAADAIAPEGSSVKEGANRPRRILVADDNQDAVDSLTLLLQHGGHKVYAAHDGVEALMAAEENRPEVMLLDIGMPKMNGYDVARRIRDQAWGKKILLVALTGWGQEEDRRRAKESGFDAHLVKPIDLQALNVLLATL